MLCQLRKGNSIKIIQCVNELYLDEDRQVTVCKTARDAYLLYLKELAEMLMDGWEALSYPTKNQIDVT